MLRLRAYGLDIQADLPFPLFREQQVDTPPDLRIQEGAVPTEPDDPERPRPCFDRVGDALILRTALVADCLITGGREITLARKPFAELHRVFQLLRGWALGAVFAQRGIVALHAASVVVGTRTICLCGPGGSGKSTLSLSLSRKACPLLDDNISVVTNNGGEPSIEPGIPKIRLLRGSPFEAADLTGGIPVVGYGSRKLEFDLNEAQWSNHHRPLGAVYILDRKAEQFSISPVTGPNKFVELLHNSYGLDFFDALGTMGQHASRILALCRLTRVFRVSAPFSLDPNEVAGAIEQHQLSLQTSANSNALRRQND